jgi:hypothetical protein
MGTPVEVVLTAKRRRELAEIAAKAAVPALHVVLDNSSTHGTSEVRE